MSDADKLIIVLIMLSLMFIGVLSIFNLGASITPALDVSFKGSAFNIFWTVLLRFIIAPALIIIPAWIGYNVIVN